MMSRMIINFASANTRALTIRNAATGIRRGTLNSRDGRSTIRANRNGQVAFETAQRGIAAFSSAVAEGSSMINAAARSFRELDEVHASLSFRAGGR